MTEQQNRIYAADLLKRAEHEFSAYDVALVAKVIETIEADIAAGLDTDLHGTVSRRRIIEGVKAGEYRKINEGIIQ